MSDLEQRDSFNMFKGYAEDAAYKQSNISGYSHNAFIEALPPIYDAKTAAKRMQRTPRYQEDMRRQPAHLRIHQVMSLLDVYVPMPQVILLEQIIGGMIRQGYKARNPLAPETKRQMLEEFPGIEWTDNEYQPKMPTKSQGLLLAGTSGMGKTSALESTLLLYPQVIRHTSYNGKPFDRQQLVWLKLECPHAGSIKSLCLQFFKSVDTILGTRYFNRKKKSSVDILVEDMALLAAQLGLGLLVIDEIQFLNEAKSGGAKEMLNFFTALRNVVGVPVVMAGTYSSLRLMTQVLANARRNETFGSEVWVNMPHDDTWRHFLRGIWKYQFTKTKTELTEEIEDTMYELTVGIPDFAIKLYMLSQWEIFSEDPEDEEIITPQILRDVFKSHLSLSNKILEKIRSGDDLGVIEDISPDFKYLVDIRKRTLQRVVLEGNIPIGVRDEISDAGEDSPVLEIATWLMEAGYDARVAQECATSAVKMNSKSMEITVAKRDAIRLAMERQQMGVSRTDARKPSKRTKKQSYKEGSLLISMTEIRNDKTNIPDFLEKMGFMRNADEFVRHSS